MLSSDEVLAQSKGAMKQWEGTWRKNAKLNGDILQERGLSNQRVYGHGLGRKAVCVAFASSLEKHVLELKEQNEAVDILSVDKGMGYLLKNDVKPKFVYLADAGIDYNKWCKPFLKDTEDITLMMNVTANPEWPKNWRGNIVFYVNQDNIQTEKIFMPISRCNEVVKASSNVGNSILVHAATYLLYDEYYLIGYDFCWGDDDNYYCGNDTDKRWYMNHNQLLTSDYELVNTSQNLLFSARWMSDFIKGILVPAGKQIYTCSKKNIVNLPYRDIKRVLKKSKQRELSKEEIDHVIQTRIVSKVIKPEDGENALKDAITKNDVMEIIVRHLPKDLYQPVVVEGG